MSPTLPDTHFTATLPDPALVLDRGVGWSIPAKIWAPRQWNVQVGPDFKVEGMYHAPNWFHRLMQRWVLGFRWWRTM